MLKLIIGDRNFSSWSLRPWLALKQAGVAFEEVGVRLYAGNTRSEILKHSPSGKVPCLIDGDTVVWDSLAICEYVAEQVPALWPADRARRAEARAVSAEMHSGFKALRKGYPMDVRAALPDHPRDAEIEADVARIVAIWEGCRARFAADGPFLFGTFSIADAMYAPVVWRFHTYGVALPPAAAAWAEHLRGLPAMQEWRAAALAEPARGA